MASPTYNSTSAAPAQGKGFMDGYVFGAPMTDFGWFASLLMGVATGMAAFFFATFIAIVCLLFSVSGGHKPDFTITYKYVGLPVGATVMVLALSYLGMLWVRRITRKS